MRRLIPFLFVAFGLMVSLRMLMTADRGSMIRSRLSELDLRHRLDAWRDDLVHAEQADAMIEEATP